MAPVFLGADPIAVRHPEGLLHGFVVLRNSEDAILAQGEVEQFLGNGRVTNQLVLHFKDGSVHDETYIFTQQRHFRLVAYHLIQKGPAFRHEIDMSLNASTGKTVVHYTDDGKNKTATENMKPQPDLSNGLISTLLNDIDPRTPKSTVSMVAATPKPRMVQLEISPDGEETFLVAGARHTANRFVIKVKIGGVSGLVAPLVGKQPPDTTVWILQGRAPGFVKSEGPLFDGGPVWKIELVGTSFPNSAGRGRP